MRFIVDGINYTECNLVYGQRYLVQIEFFFMGTYNGNYTFTNCQIYVKNVMNEIVSIPYVVPYIKTEIDVQILQTIQE